MTHEYSDDSMIFDMWRYFLTRKEAVRFHFIIGIMAILAVIYGIETGIWILLPVIAIGLVGYFAIFFFVGICFQDSRYQYFAHRKQKIQTHLDTLEGKANRLSTALEIIGRNPLWDSNEVMQNGTDVSVIKESIIEDIDWLETMAYAFADCCAAQETWTQYKNGVLDELDRAFAEYERATEDRWRELAIKQIRLQRGRLFIGMHDALFVAIKQFGVDMKTLAQERQVLEQKIEDIEQNF